MVEHHYGISIILCAYFSHQKVTYKTKRPVYDLRTIAEVEGAGVKAGKHAEWREQIIVPPLPQSALAGCSLIDIDYFIQVRVSVSGLMAAFTQHANMQHFLFSVLLKIIHFSVRVLSKSYTNSCGTVHTDVSTYSFQLPLMFEGCGCVNGTFIISYASEWLFSERKDYASCIHSIQTDTVNYTPTHCKLAMVHWVLWF